MLFVKLTASSFCNASSERDDDVFCGHGNKGVAEKNLICLRVTKIIFLLSFFALRHDC